MDSGFDDIQYVVDFVYQIINDFEKENRKMEKEKRGIETMPRQERLESSLSRPSASLCSAGGRA